MISDLATDVIVHVSEVKFYLHKVGLLIFLHNCTEVNSKVLYLFFRIVTKVETSTAARHVLQLTYSIS